MSSPWKCQLDQSQCHASFPLERPTPEHQPGTPCPSFSLCTGCDCVPAVNLTASGIDSSFKLLVTSVRNFLDQVV